MSTATSVPPTELLPPFPNRVSIQSTAFPGVYLRSDDSRVSRSVPGVKTGNLLNLQRNRQDWERHELILQDPAVYGENVYVIRSVKWNNYVFLDPIVLPEQQPREGTTFHPKGVGISSSVHTIEEASKFKIVANVADGELEGTVSFKLAGGLVENRSVYLRLDGEDTIDFQGPGSGVVNGQTYIGPFEKLLVEPFP